MIKVILLDIDGTLTDDNKDITPRTRNALMKAQEQGVRLALASGRTDHGLKRFYEALEMEKHHGLLVCFNGARVMDCQTGEIFFNQAMTIEEGRAVLEHMKKFEVSPIFDKGEYMYTNDNRSGIIHVKGKPLNIVEYESRSNGYILRRTSDLVEVADYPLNKILTAGEPDYMKEHYLELQEPFKDTLSCMFTAPFYFEFTARGIDKAKAIDTVFRNLGYAPEELMAFGDAQNDLTMLQYAGIGVAMGNAVEEVKQAADYITLSNNEDGIAAALEKFRDQLFNSELQIQA